MDCKVLAIIPARKSSKGIPNKNFRRLGGISPLTRAVRCSFGANVSCVLTSDDLSTWNDIWPTVVGEGDPVEAIVLQRPAELSGDDTPMIDVVKHVLEQVPGPPDQKIVLLQPTQPLREPKHIQQALAMLTPEVDSVVSVVGLPRTHRADVQMTILGDRLWRWVGSSAIEDPLTFNFPATRQQGRATVIRDGTCYAFHRKTVETYGNIYGACVRPLVIPASDTCELDTPADWLEAERRLKERDALS